MSGLAAPVAAPDDRSESGRAGRTAGLMGLAVSALLIVALYSRLDRHAIVEVFRSAPLWMLVLVLTTTIPINVLVALRFYWTAPTGSLPGYGESVRLTLVAKALNMFLPSKSGDLVKSYFVAKRGGASAGVAVSIIVYERLCDLLGLITWCLAGWLVSPPPESLVPRSAWIVLAALGGMCLVLITSERSAAWVLALVHRLFPSRRLQRLRDMAAGWPDLHREIRGRRRWITLISIVLWLFNMGQLWLLTFVVGAPVPFAESLGMFTLVVVAGQLPLTFAGLGARDVALVVLSTRYMSGEKAAAVGLLSATLGFIPALAAVPILRPYLSIAAGDAARWRRQRAAAAARHAHRQ